MDSGTMTFNTHSIFKKFVQAGIKEDQAEVIIDAINESRSADLSTLEKEFENRIDHLATKADIANVRTEISQSEKRLILMMGGMAIAICSTMFGLLKYFFHLG